MSISVTLYSTAFLVVIGMLVGNKHYISSTGLYGENLQPSVGLTGAWCILADNVFALRLSVIWFYEGLAGICASGHWALLLFLSLIDTHRVCSKAATPKHVSGRRNLCRYVVILFFFLAAGPGWRLPFWHRLTVHREPRRPSTSHREDRWHWRLPASIVPVRASWLYITSLNQKRGSLVSIPHVSPCCCCKLAVCWYC